MTEPRIIEGELSEKGEKPKTTELTVKNDINQPALIIGENSVEVATKVANSLAEVVEKQKLFSMITGKKYVKVEGWNTLGALMGVFPEVVSVEKLPAKTVKMFQIQQTKNKKNFQTNSWETYTVLVLMNPAFYDPTDAKMKKVGEVDFEEIAYKATVMLKRAGDGHKVSQAEAFCSNLEESKNKNDEYAINSMAQTRATGKAFRIAFSWIMAMAGYEATPAEEIPEGGFENQEAPKAPANSNQTAFRKTINNDEPTYEPIPDKPTPAQKPWQRDARFAPKTNTTPAPAVQQFECFECGAVIPLVVKEYSEKFYGHPFCRQCQPHHEKIR